MKNKLIVQFSVDYKIGDEIITDDRKYKIIGYEHVPDRGLRYILIHSDGGAPKWEYLYKIEILMLKNK